MNQLVSALALASLVAAVADPSAKCTTEKECKEYLKDNLTSLKAEEIAALGTENKKICGYIKDKESYMEEKKDSFLRRMRTNINFDCALQMAQENPEAFDALFQDITSAGRRAFFARHDPTAVCANKEKLSKTDGKITTALSSYCEEKETKEKIAEAKKKKQEKEMAAAKKSGVELVKASSALLLGIVLFAGILV